MMNLKNHVNAHIGNKPNKCKYYRCKAKFVTSGELIRHVKYVHTQEKEFHCTECEYSSVEKSKLERHMTVHTGSRPYQCDRCTYASSDNFKLKRHMRIHTGERPYKCDLCPAAFAQQNALKVHSLVHTGKKVLFQCPYCPTMLGRKIDVRNHVDKQHTPIGPIFCEVCNQSFTDRYSMRMHKKSHSGEKCFKCRQCPFESASQRLLEEHKLVHTGEKPFKCNICNKAFRIKQLLKRHHESKHNTNHVVKKDSHKCFDCGKKYQRLGSLKNHLLLHSKGPESTKNSIDFKMWLSKNDKIGSLKSNEKDVELSVNDDVFYDESNHSYANTISNSKKHFNEKDAVELLLKHTVSYNQHSTNDSSENIITDEQLLPKYGSKMNRSNSIESKVSDVSSPNMDAHDDPTFFNSCLDLKYSAIPLTSNKDKRALAMIKLELDSCFGFESEEE